MRQTTRTDTSPRSTYPAVAPVVSPRAHPARPPPGTTEAKLLGLASRGASLGLGAIGRGLTQRQAAEPTGLTQQWLSAIESGREPIGPITRLAAIYTDEAPA